MNIYPLVEIPLFASDPRVNESCWTSRYYAMMIMVVVVVVVMLARQVYVNWQLMSHFRPRSPA